MTPSIEIPTQTVRGTLWAYLSFLLGKGLTFITTVILARLLVPEQFGVVGYCLIAIQYLDILNTAGIDSALISRRDKVQEAANAAFVINVAVGLASFGLAWIAAPSVAGFFKAEAVTDLFRALAVVLPISGLGLVPDAMLQRNLQFKSRLVPGIGRSLVKGIASVLLAWAGWGVWSLVWGQVAGEVVSTALLWRLARWRPTFAFDRRAAREMLVFGGHIIAIEVVGALESNVDYLVVGRLLGAAALGYYTMAYRIPELVIRSLNYVVARVALPVLSQAQSDAGQLRAIYFGYIRHVALFTFPAGLGLALVARPFVTTFYTSRWEPAASVMALIAVSIGISSIGHVPGVLYKAINRPGILNQLSLVKLPLALGILWFSTRWGIVGVGAGQLVMAVIYVTLDCVMVSRVMRFSLRDTMEALTPAIAATAAMGLTVGSASALFSLVGASGLAVMVLVGISAYAAALALVSRDTVVRAGAVLRAALARP